MGVKHLLIEFLITFCIAQCFDMVLHCIVRLYLCSELVALESMFLLLSTTYGCRGPVLNPIYIYSDIFNHITFNISLMYFRIPKVFLTQALQIITGWQCIDYKQLMKTLSV